MSWIPWQSTFMSWLTADSMRITIFGTSILCLVGCVFAAFFGWLSRRSKMPRMMLGFLSTSLLSWIFFVSHGAVGVLPAVFAFFIAAKSGETPKPHEIFLFAIFIVSFIAVFTSFWIFSKPKLRGKS
jgi:hypothetical protein